MTAERPDLSTEDDAAALRRALVRFLVESSFEGSPQAKIAEELLAAVRRLPGQSADLATRLERRTEKLEGLVARLSDQVEHLSGFTSSVPEALSKQVSRELQGVIKEAARREEGADKLRKLSNDTLQDALRALQAIESLAGTAGRAPPDARTTADPRGRPVLPVARGLTGRRRDRPAPGLLTTVLTSVIASVVAALVTAGLLANVLSTSGARHTATEEAAAGATGSAQASVAALAYSSPSRQEGAPAASSASAPSSAQTSAAALPPWRRLWESALEQRISSCPDSAAGTLRECLCPGTEEDCTPRAVQRSDGRSVLLLQGVLMAYNPTSISKIDGHLGKGTLSALLKMAKGCGAKVTKPAQKLADEWGADSKPQSVEGSIDAILDALQNSPQQCLEPHPDGRT